jgi:hypothetical protein
MSPAQCVGLGEDKEANIEKWPVARRGAKEHLHKMQGRAGQLEARDSRRRLITFRALQPAARHDAAGPGCKWADMNADGVANGADIQLFVNMMLG